MNTNNQLESFAKELKALLEKYDVTIICSTDYDSNAFFVDDKIFAVNNKTNETRILSQDTYLSAKDI